MSRLSGKKTYILAILGALALVLWNLDAMLHDDPATAVIETGWLSEVSWITILGFFGFGSTASLRHGQNRV